jgi:hypothetical protein
MVLEFLIPSHPYILHDKEDKEAILSVAHPISTPATHQAVELSAAVSVVSEYNITLLASETAHE